MAFDITPYIHETPEKVRQLIREGTIDFPTAGMCAGYAQANLVILPPEYAADFEEFTRLNPFPCPVLEIVKGTPETHAMGEGGNIVTDAFGVVAMVAMTPLITIQILGMTYQLKQRHASRTQQAYVDAFASLPEDAIIEL